MDTLSRRSFLATSLAAGAFLFVPEWVRKAREAVSLSGQILGAPVDPRHTLFAHKERSGVYTLCLDGKRYSEPSPMTLRQYISKREGIPLSRVDRLGRGHLEFEYGIRRQDLDKDASLAHGYGDSYGFLSAEKSPEALGYRYVRSVLDKISASPSGAERLGGISLVSPSMPLCDFWAAEAEDLLSLQCLQKTLVSLGHKTAVVLAS